MALRQQDHTRKSIVPTGTFRHGSYSFKAAVPLIAGLLTIAAILKGAPTALIILLSAAGACFSAAMLCSIPRTEPNMEIPAAAPPVEPPSQSRAQEVSTENPTQTVAHAREEYGERRRQYEQTLETINNLTGVITHDMDHRLEIINANIEAVIDRLDEQPSLRRKLRMVQETLRKASSLMTKLASFSSQKDWQTQRVDISEHIASTANLIRKSLLSETTDLHVEAEHDLWPVDIDPDQLQMSIINLALNSREAMPRGGTITLTAKNVTLGDDMLKLYGDFVSVTVSDTGSGIAPENIDRVFSPFFSTKKLRNGIGIGLNQVKTLAIHVNGDVTVDSMPGEGTSVTLYLPRANGSQWQNTEAPAQNVLPPVEVLIAENAKDIAADLEAMVVTMGHTVRTATSPTAALSTLRTDAPNLVVTDIKMPGTIDGVTLARQLRHRHPDIPIVLMTDNPLIATDHSDFSFLLKPVTREKLEAILRQHLAMPKDVYGNAQV